MRSELYSRGFSSSDIRCFLPGLQIEYSSGGLITSKKDGVVIANDGLTLTLKIGDEPHMIQVVDIKNVLIKYL